MQMAGSKSINNYMVKSNTYQPSGPMAMRQKISTEPNSLLQSKNEVNIQLIQSQMNASAKQVDNYNPDLGGQDKFQTQPFASTH